MKTSQLALNSVSMDFTDFEASLEAVRAAGFRKIEFCLDHVHDYLKAGHTSAGARAQLDAHGLQCIGGFQCTLESFSPPEQRKANHARIVENARLLAALGGNQLVVGTDGPAEARYPETLQEIAENLRAVAQRTQEARVNILIEFNWGPHVKSFRTAAEVVRLSGAPNVGVLFDPAHYHCTPSKPEQFTPENIATVRHVHVDDMRDKPGELSNCNSDRLLPGQGCLDLSELFGRLEKHGYAGDFSIEMFDDALRNLPPQESAKRMYQSLLPLCQN